MPPGEKPIASVLLAPERTGVPDAKTEGETDTDQARKRHRLADRQTDGV